MTTSQPDADLASGAPHPRLDALIATLERLRAPGGCAWDREQTHGSLVQYLLEETYELTDAIEHGGVADRLEELGDVLYQVLFHADIATEAGEFTIDDVAEHMRLKMVGRHPHVFGDAQADTAEQVVVRWEEQKRLEKPERTSVLDGIPQAMPSLLLAAKLLGRAERVGVAPSPVVQSEISIPAAEPDASPEAREAALGAQLLAIVTAARRDGLDAERALRGALRGLQERIRDAEAEDEAARPTGVEVAPPPVA